MELNLNERKKILEDVLSVHEKDRKHFRKKLASLRVKIHRIKKMIEMIDQLELDLDDK